MRSRGCCDAVDDADARLIHRAAAHGQSANREPFFDAGATMEIMHGRSLLPILIGAVVLLLAVEVRADVPIVYSRCPRTTADLELSGDVNIGGTTKKVTRTLKHVDVFDDLPDVSLFYGGFNAPCDLMHRDADGNETVLYSCTDQSTAEHACAVLDPAVSFDGGTVAFAVFRGKLEHPRELYIPRLLDPEAENDDTYGVDLPSTKLVAEGAHLMLVDIDTGTLTELTPYQGATDRANGVWDSGPAWLSDGRIAFTSNRESVYVTLVNFYVGSSLVSQIHTIDPDGRNVEVASHHALAGEQHPLQLMDGRVAYSSWQLFGLLPFRTTNGSPGGVGTLRNFFHIYTQNPDGAHPFPIYGQHTVNFGGQTHDAAHFLGQTSDGWVWTADYYRENNKGMGHIFGFALPPEGQEGWGPDEDPEPWNVYRPREFVALAKWATNADNFSKLMPAPEPIVPGYADPLAFAGKLRDPVGLPGNEMMVVWGKGACSTVAINEVLGDNPPPLTSGSGFLVPLNTLTHLGRDNPGCDAGIYRLTKRPSEHPSDLEPIVDTVEYHELMPRAAVPYADIYGIEKPAQRPQAAATGKDEPALVPGTPFGILGAASMLFRETRSLDGHPFEGEFQWGLQGTDAADYTDDEICGLRILAVQPNGPMEYTRLLTAPGERVLVMGEIPVRNFAEDGTPLVDPMGLPDTSFAVRFPANMPYLMQAIDCQGRTLNTDQTWQHVRPSEKKTCGGCHVHGKEGLAFDQTAAAFPGYQTRLLGEGMVPLLAGGSGKDVETREVDGWGVQYEFERDVVPIFEARCNGCHSGAGAAAGLQLDLPGSEEGSTWWRLVRDRRQAYVPMALRHQGSSGETLRNPQLTKYVRFMNSRGSLLYWKAANERTDGRSDDQYGDGQPSADWNDVDFGGNHPTDITPEELGILSRWIDTGAGAGEGFLLDTSKPTLTLVADVDQDTVTGLRVGTVDVGSGVDPGSLEVCILQQGDLCGSNLAGPAALAGVVELALPSPLSDPDIEVRARVRDHAGNQTELRRTVRRLLNQPPTPPDNPGGTDTGDTDGPGTSGTSGATDTSPDQEDGGGNGGCGCQAPPSSGRAGEGWLALVLIAAGRRYARRRRCVAQPGEGRAH